MAAQKKYPDELRERAVKMVLEIRERDGKGQGELARVARQLGVHPEALRSWVKQAEIDGGLQSGTTTDDKKRMCQQPTAPRIQLHWSRWRRRHQYTARACHCRQRAGSGPYNVTVTTRSRIDGTLS